MAEVLQSSHTDDLADPFFTLHSYRTMCKYEKRRYWPFPNLRPFSSAIWVSIGALCESPEYMLIIVVFTLAAAVSDELAKQNTRKTVSVSDVIEGLGLMEFPEDIRAEVKANLKVFRQLEADKKAAAGSKSAGGAADASTADAGDDDEEDPADDDEQQDESERQVQSATTAAGGEEQPVARPADEKDVDEEDEDTEQKMVGEGAQDGEEEDGGGGGDDQDEDMDS